MKIIIVGVGALGSHVAMLLRNEAELRLVDDGRLEAKNCLAQFHPKSGVGQNKAEVLARTLQFLWGHRPETIRHKLVEENARTLLGGGDLIIDCLDNIAGRQVILNHARVPVLHGALSADGLFGRVQWGCFVPDAETPGAATCEDGRFLPFIALVASALAGAAQRFIAEGVQHSFYITPTSLQRV